MSGYDRRRLRRHLRRARPDQRPLGRLRPADGERLRRSSSRTRGATDVRRSTRIELRRDPDRVEVVGALVDGGLPAAPRAVPDPGRGRDVRPGRRRASRSTRPDFDHAVHELRRSYEDWERESHADRHRQRAVQPPPRARACATFARCTRGSTDGAILAAGHPLVRDDLRPRRADRVAPAADGDHAAGARRAQAPGGAPGHGARTTGATRSPARSCTRSARRARRAPAICRTRRTTGRVDSTPWFLILLYAQYFRWTGDSSSRGSCCPSAEAALGVDRPLRRPGRRRLRRVPVALAAGHPQPGLEGLARRDGPRRRTAGRPPIALSEVQAYVYLAKTADGRRVRGARRPEDARRLRGRGRTPEAPVQRGVLDGGRAVLRDGARRRQAAGPNA